MIELNTRIPLFECLECHRKYYSTKAAERASLNGCSCGGVDIDVYVSGGKPVWNASTVLVRS